MTKPITFSSSVNRRAAGYRIANNYVHHCGLEDYGAYGVEVSEVQDTVIAHNLIHDTAYFGMCVAGSQAWRETPFARNNTVEHNHVHDAMQVTVDGAGLYVTFAHADRSCVVRGNLLHNVFPNRFSNRDAGPFLAAGIYLDGDATGYLFENNVVFRTFGGLFNGNMGHNAWLENVIQKEGSPPAEFIEAVQTHAGLEPAYRRALLKTETPSCDFHRPPGPDWTEVHAPAEGLPVIELGTNRQAEIGDVVYAVTTLAAPAARPVTLHFGATSQAQLWLNGQPIGCVPNVKGLGCNKLTVPLELRSGENCLVVKLQRFWERRWMFCASLSDRMAP
ncbi:MAG: right-handed parallel beta-helix repeat-containing protein [Planctomycetota bacterium]|nr:right-handed parallel beta-helix repeat-containing protein [Planctomycetota bacterium]